MSTDGTTPVIDPLALTELEPPGEVVLEKGPKDLSEEDLKEYAKRTGVEVIKLKKIAQQSVLGELAQRIGAAKIGSAMLIEGAPMIQEAIKEVDQMLGDYAHDSKLVGALMKTKLGLLDLWVKAAQAHISSKKDAGPEGSEQKPLQTPFPPPNLSQTNIYVNGVSQDKPSS